MGGFWYSMTRLNEPFVGLQKSKEMAAANERTMRKVMRETVVPVVCAVAAAPSGPCAMVVAAASGKEAMRAIYPEENL